MKKSPHPSLGEELTVGDQNQGGGDNKNLHPIDTVEISYFTFNSIKIFELQILAPDSYWTDTRKCMITKQDFLTKHLLSRFQLFFSQRFHLSDEIHFWDSCGFENISCLSFSSSFPTFQRRKRRFFFCP